MGTKRTNKMTLKRTVKEAKELTYKIKYFMFNDPQLRVEGFYFATAKETEYLKEPRVMMLFNCSFALHYAAIRKLVDFCEENGIEFNIDTGNDGTLMILINIFLK